MEDLENMSSEELYTALYLKLDVEAYRLREQLRWKKDEVAGLERRLKILEGKIRRVAERFPTRAA